ADFCNDAKTIDAVIRNLEIIGEAARRLPEEIRIKFPDVEWHKIISLRNILIHEYPGIDLETIWDIIENKLPPVKIQVKEILKGQQ
ncbi:MAG: HepT-like ribonuclease domain-containing protein, partial [Desulfobaccales bacterium]